jgi:hypothetical protein
VVSSQRARICACVLDVSDGLAGRPTVCGELSALAAEAGARLLPRSRLHRRRLTPQPTASSSPPTSSSG